MSGKQYFAALGQQDFAHGRKRPLNNMRGWPTWAFDAYAHAWIAASFGVNEVRD